MSIYLPIHQSISRHAHTYTHKIHRRYKIAKKYTHVANIYYTHIKKKNNNLRSQKLKKNFECKLNVLES